MRWEINWKLIGKSEFLLILPAFQIEAGILINYFKSTEKSYELR